MRAVDSVEEEHFETLIPSRKRLRPGDIFVMKPRRRDFLFGRVIDVDAHALGDLGGAILIYVYDASSPSMDEVPELTRDRLLVPPVMMNRLGWSRGFLHSVGHRPWGPDDVLTTHCFIDRSYRAGPRYVDERNRALPGPIEPVGQAGLASYGWLFDVIVATPRCRTTPSHQPELRRHGRGFDPVGIGCTGGRVGCLAGSVRYGSRLNGRRSSRNTSKLALTATSGSRVTTGCSAS